jgi:hypothetical protein
MKELALIREQMEIIGSDGQHIGMVLTVEDEWLTLATSEPGARPPRLPLSLVDRVETVIRLNAPAADIISVWLARHPGATDSPPITS